MTTQPIFADPDTVKLSEEQTFFGKEYSLETTVAERILVVQEAATKLSGLLSLMKRGAVPQEQFSSTIEDILRQIDSSFSTSARKARRTKEKSNG